MGKMIMMWLPLVKYLVVSNIIAIIPVNKRKKFKWINRLTDNKITKKLSEAVLDNFTWRRHLKQGTLVANYMFFLTRRGACPCIIDGVW